MSVTDSVAVREPVRTGVKVTLMEHEVPAASVEPQLFVWVKSPWLAPVMLMPVMVNGPVPALVRLTACAGLAVPVFWLPKERAAGLREAAGVVPVPVNGTDDITPVSPSHTSKEAARAPVAAGANVTVMLHDAPWATGWPQVLVWAKSDALAPEMEIL